MTSQTNHREEAHCSELSGPVDQTKPGSVGATVRMYIEKYEPDVSKQGLMTAEVLRPLVDIGLKLSKLEEFTGRVSPTVIT